MTLIKTGFSVWKKNQKKIILVMQDADSGELTTELWMDAKILTLPK